MRMNSKMIFDFENAIYLHDILVHYVYTDGNMCTNRVLNAYSRRYEIKLSFKSISQYEKIKI